MTRTTPISSAGTVVSGRLWFCSQCLKYICIPCSSAYHDDHGTGLLCPYCEGKYSHGPTAAEAERMRKKGGRDVLAVIVTLAVLAGGAFAVWKYMSNP